VITVGGLGSQRIKGFLALAIHAHYETVEDTLRDLANYAIMELVELKKQEEK